MFCCLCEMCEFFFFLACIRKTIHFCWKQQKQFLCPPHCDHCSDYERLFAAKTLMWRAQNGRGQMGGISLDLWCQIAHPHHRYVLSSEYQNVKRRLYLLLQHRLKTEWYFWDQQTSLDVPSETLSQTLRLNWHYMRSRTVKSTLSFVSLRVNWGPEEIEGHQETGVLQEKATWDLRYEHGCQPVLHHLPPVRFFILFFFTHPEMCHLSLFAGASRKKWGTWIRGKYFLRI